MFPVLVRAERKVRVLLHPGAVVEVQALPAPAEAGMSRLVDYCKAKVQDPFNYAYQRRRARHAL